MSDNDSYELSEQDIVFIRTALDALDEDLKDMVTDVTTRTSALWNIGLINSAKEKLNNRDMQFSDDECKVMYAAALNMRDLMNRILDEKATSEYDRDMARSTLHSSNALMRILRKTFISNGMNVDDLT